MIQQQKNYVVLINDHSGSMRPKAAAALADYNQNIDAIRGAATSEMQDTVVSVFGIGLTVGRMFSNSPVITGHQCSEGVVRQVTISNPHVLKPMADWPTPGGTPLFDALGRAIEFVQSLPDINEPHVSVLVMITTDGEEEHSRDFDELRLAKLMYNVSATGKWTFSARIPKNPFGKGLQTLLKLGFPADNIYQWENTAAGLTASSAATQAGVSSYFRARSAGAKSTSSFYADASKVDITALEDISKKVSLYVVPPEANGIEIRPFVLQHRMDYLKGSAFYQLTKTEAKVSHTKQVLVRDRASGKIFHGPQARSMIGLPTDRNARLHPGDHKNFDLFIQSESVNRKLVGGTGLVYWKEIGVPFTEADLAYLQPKAPVVAAAPAPVQLPAVVPTNRPTPSPIPVTPRFEYFDTREDARLFCGAHGIVQSSILKNPTAIKGKKWSVPSALVGAKKTAAVTI